MATSSSAVASGSNQASSSSPQVVSEYVVRVPRSNKKKFNVMRFTNSTGIDVTKFGQTSLKMERENNMKEKGIDEEAPKFGAGSEFGREQREEARKKRYTSKKSYKSEDQPWVLKLGGKTGRKYKGIRGGGITENASYYVFMKAPDGAFEAFPVEEWYNFAPIQRYKALSAEEAEEEFGKREKVMNFFSIMLKKRLTLDDKGGEPAEGEENTTEKKGKKKGSKSELKLTDMDEWLSDSDNESNEDGDKSGDDDDGKKKKEKAAQKGKGKKAAKNKKKKNESDEEAIEESDEGDFDDREVDYMSDSSTSSEEPAEEKMNKQMKGVEDEEAMMKLNVSDDDEEEQKEEQKEGEKKDGAAEGETPSPAEKKPDPKAAKAKPEKKGSSGDSSPESSDSDFDDSKFNSAMFMQKPKKRGTDSANSSRANTPTKSNGTKSSKRKQQQANDGNNSSIGAPASKKIKSEASATAAASAGSPSEGISEEAVKRYLMRKPMTTTELLQKFKSKRIGISGDQLVTTIAQILKRLNPEKQTIKGKLYLSIKA